MDGAMARDGSYDSRSCLLSAGNLAAFVPEHIHAEDLNDCFRPGIQM